MSPDRDGRPILCSRGHEISSDRDVTAEGRCRRCVEDARAETAAISAPPRWRRRGLPRHR